MGSEVKRIRSLEKNWITNPALTVNQRASLSLFPANIGNRGFVFGTSSNVLNTAEEMSGHWTADAEL